MAKSQNRGVYLPEWPDLEKAAAAESGKAGKPVTAGGYLREVVQKHLRGWAKKNPSTPLDISRV